MTRMLSELSVQLVRRVGCASSHLQYPTPHISSNSLVFLFRLICYLELELSCFRVLHALSARCLTSISPAGYSKGFATHTAGAAKVTGDLNDLKRIGALYPCNDLKPLLLYQPQAYLLSTLSLPWNDPPAEQSPRETRIRTLSYGPRSMFWILGPY